MVQRRPKVMSARWIVMGLVFSSLLAGAAARAEASEPAQNITCQWQRLDNGERRSQHTLVYLPDSQGIMAFAGGDMRRSGSSLKDDLHFLPMADASSKTWKRVTVSGGPGDRMQHSAILRQVPGGGQEMVTFGGDDALPGGGTLTWRSPLLGGGFPRRAFLGGRGPLDVVKSIHKLNFNPDGAVAGWQQMNVPGGPFRTDHSAIWAPSEDGMIVFGGRRGEGANTAENTTWMLTLGASPEWSRLDSSAGPSKRFGHTAIEQTSAVRMVVFGGTKDWTTGMNDVWALRLLDGFDFAEWERVATTGTPPRGRFDHAAAYLPNLDWMVIVGGTANGQRELDDVWALDLSQDPAVWMSLSPTGNGPPGLIGLAGTYSATGDMAVFQGGQVGPDARDQTWGLSCGAPTVPTETPSPSPTATQAPGPSATPTTPTATATFTLPPPTNTLVPPITSTPTRGATEVMVWRVFMPLSEQR